MSKWKNDSAYKSFQSAGYDPLDSDSSPGEKSTAARSVWARGEGRLRMEVGEKDLGCWVQPHRNELPASHEGKSRIPVCTASLCHKTWLYWPCKDMMS